jgi:3-oxoacyl-[acyl-carrier-protein] synthase-3
MHAMQSVPVIGMSGVAGVLAPARLELEELEAQGLIASSPAVLRELGFARAHVATSTNDTGEMALQAARDALQDAGLEPGRIDLLVWASARPESQVRRCGATDSRTSELFDGFRYQAAWLQETLGAENADVIGMSQQGCSTMFSALRTARALLATEPERTHALCVASDVLPAGAPREILYNVMSDGACAVVLSKACSTDRWQAFRQISSGYYWDPEQRGPEIMASYFVTGRQIIHDLLAAASVRPDEIDVVIPTGINRLSWDVMMRLVGIPADRLYEGPESFGHTVSADTFIHLAHLRRHNGVPAGSKLLAFTYGFGSTWCALLLEH